MEGPWCREAEPYFPGDTYLLERAACVIDSLKVRVQGLFKRHLDLAVPHDHSSVEEQG